MKIVSIIVCYFIFFSICYSLRADQTITMPKQITKSELKRCKRMKPTFNAMLVIGEENIYWKMRSGKQIVCVKVRVD